MNMKQWISFCIVTSILFYAEGGEINKEGLSLWRRTMCIALEKGDSDFLNKIDSCFNLEEKKFFVAWKECLDEIVPSTGGSFELFHNIACRDHSVYDKIDECMTEKGEARGMLDEKEPAGMCYKKLFKNSDYPELLVYFRHEG
ncbi:uncharacterized protein [Parasteatoda tepidariorum]|uniref:uncharacterized protein n=1 Tax=Parasteatoda tepidariorum TaxID=114398 RepID=UPI00077FB80A|nr:uncharacterized protein LOC107442341 [Parasteatoda tepidariorum]XP_015911373.1 uncharacterized protein LOC107442341 [Parasteatoda tepidariorum]XP_015911375.1 uncharacterized protein LOC107442341 [Parasteatoda tepidariorum]XP_042909034.1 uncharacterized protein LOC107442341 [Parasteatoda tepidariorum]